MNLLKRLFVSLLGLVLFTCGNPQRQNVSKAKVNIVSNNVNIDYTDTGSGDTTLLFVHGWAINKTYWADQVKHFGSRYRVITIDLPGYGQSDKNREEFNTRAFGADVKNVINQLKLKKVVLIGHSMAGDIILQGAIDAPENVIALVGVDNFKSAGVAPTGDTSKAKKEYAEAIAAMKKNFKKFAFEWFNQLLFFKTTSKAIRERILNDVAHTDSTVAIKSLAWDDFNEGDQLLKAKKMLYLINSDYQPTDTTGLSAKKIPFKLFKVHATGHFPMVEKPDEFNKQLDKVMADLKKR
ncbi:alpha/beta fold hydrolase [Mucilaginibacter glaciei]|uniref:Alpha/beta hydrolase n=1 Tax=Mucilaginibacter glaciei TaxID=2772109 RepID=A0A926NTM8_9SPHI|nr:alpha/beta hydrolase [Mucilaginibacter glaciei]MBD1394802.1 alpha/beta hydrolase [Mucilaginibacter glaciei]